MGDFNMPPGVSVNDIPGTNDQMESVVDEVYRRFPWLNEAIPDDRQKSFEQLLDFVFQMGCECEQELQSECDGEKMLAFREEFPTAEANARLAANGEQLKPSEMMSIGKALLFLLERTKHA